MEGLARQWRAADPASAGVAARAVEPAAGPWWVVHTRARHEKIVARMLDERGVPHYLPLICQSRSYDGRRQQVSLPLFPGYLFFRGGAAEREAALRTNRVASVLPVVDQAQIETELQHIRQLIETGQTVGLYPALKRGRRCRVIGGPLRGVEGVVVQRRQPSRMYVAATILGQCATVEIDASLLAPLD